MPSPTEYKSHTQDPSQHPKLLNSLTLRFGMNCALISWCDDAVLRPVTLVIEPGVIAESSANGKNAQQRTPEERHESIAENTRLRCHPGGVQSSFFASGYPEGIHRVRNFSGFREL